MADSSLKPVRNVFVSVFSKDGLEEIIQSLKSKDVNFYASGGTHAFLEKQGVKVTSVEDLTGFPPILGGRVKTLHPKVFGGILYRGDEEDDQATLQSWNIPPMDLVITDLYPFAETLQQEASHEDIIEKIDIGGISLIRAAAKNYRDVMVVPDKSCYNELLQFLKENDGQTTLDQRKYMAVKAFRVSNQYDGLISEYLELGQETGGLEIKESPEQVLRYGENPHQNAAFYGPLSDLLEQLNGKQLSYNNLVDVDAAVDLIEDFNENKAFGIIKHTNPCGLAVSSDSFESWKKSLEGDPVSAFGGIIIANHKIEEQVAREIDELFYEILIAPDFSEEALKVLTAKKNRIILRKKQKNPVQQQYKSVLNGVLKQDKDHKSESREDLSTATKVAPSESNMNDLLSASRVCKHTKSNAIVLFKDGQLIGSGMGQTSRVDALKQAIAKARHFNFDTRGAVMASDAFFPFPDCVEIGAEAGIEAIIQPGGSKKDQESIDSADKHGISMVLSGLRHFKH